MDIDRVIESIEQRSHNLYREEADRADRLAWHVGALESKLREVASDIYAKCVSETAKQRYEWVGLTIEEAKTIVDSATSDNAGYDIVTDGAQVAFLVEAKLKEKNT